MSQRWLPAATIGGNAWYHPQTINPTGVEATYATSGRYNFWGYDQPTIADYAMQMRADVSLPADSAVYLRFNHAFSFDAFQGKFYDGGVVEYSVDGGATWTVVVPATADAASAFATGGRLGSISAITATSTEPTTW